MGYTAVVDCTRWVTITIGAQYGRVDPHVRCGLGPGRLRFAVGDPSHFGATMHVAKMPRLN